MLWCDAIGLGWAFLPHKKMALLQFVALTIMPGLSEYRKLWVMVHKPMVDPAFSCFTDANGTTWCALDNDLMRHVDRDDSY